MTNDTEPMVREDGTYPTVELSKPMYFAAVVQTRVGGVNGENPAPDIRRNLDYFLECIDKAQGYGPPNTLLLFHEFPITGFSEWTREQQYNLAIEVPGPEVAEVGKKAKQYGCYIVFGTYAKDPENWPGHILHLMVMVGPDGEVVAKHWKQRNVRGLFPGSEQFSTSIYDVYDRFVEMYGLDAVVPVVRTDIGNIAMSAVQFEPELFRCMAMKGAEIICRVATGGFEYEDMRLTSYHNSVYTMITNNSVTTHGETPGFFEDEAYGGPGRSAIFGPRGVVLEECGVFESRKATMIPIAQFRQTHRIPDVHMDLYRPIFDQYRTRYDHSAYLEYLPKDKRDAFRVFQEQCRWTHYW
ncbi:MAG: nitrilase-related carbon-nitrogen hydrolase [Gammaproteobacteria bacterium]|nr:nitrilase-related carbon-nitrogen hydrolase [Gammaproteobacteria bacterium]